MLKHRLPVILGPSVPLLGSPPHSATVHSPVRLSARPGTAAMRPLQSPASPVGAQTTPFTPVIQEAVACPGCAAHIRHLQGDICIGAFGRITGHSAHFQGPLLGAHNEVRDQLLLAIRAQSQPPQLLNSMRGQICRAFHDCRKCTALPCCAQLCMQGAWGLKDFPTLTLAIHATSVDPQRLDCRIDTRLLPNSWWSIGDDGFA